MGGKQLGFGNDEQSTARKHTKLEKFLAVIGNRAGRWTAPASSPPSTILPLLSGTPSMISRCSAAAPSARTAGGSAPVSTMPRGTSARKRCAASFLGVETYTQTFREPIPSGEVTLTMLFEADKARPGTGGTITLLANGRAIGDGRIPRTVLIAFTTYGGMDIGRDNGVLFDLKPHPHGDEQAPYEQATMTAVGRGAAG